MKDLDEFTRAYIEAALWSSTDESTPSGGVPLDRNFSVDDIDPATLEKMIADCKKFQGVHWRRIKSNVKGAGHDFWLTRNHHGAGFWDGDWPDQDAKILTSTSHQFGEKTLYVGDDNRIHQM